MASRAQLVPMSGPSRCTVPPAAAYPRSAASAAPPTHGISGAAHPSEYPLPCDAWVGERDNQVHPLPDQIRSRYVCPFSSILFVQYYVYKDQI